MALSNIAYMSAPGAHDRHEPVERVAALRHRLRAKKLQRQCRPQGHQHKVQLDYKQEDDSDNITHNTLIIEYLLGRVWRNSGFTE